MRLVLTCELKYVKISEVLRWLFLFCFRFPSKIVCNLGQILQLKYMVSKKYGCFCIGWVSTNFHSLNLSTSVFPVLAVKALKKLV